MRCFVVTFLLKMTINNVICFPEKGWWSLCLTQEMLLVFSDSRADLEPRVPNPGRTSAKRLYL